MARARWFAASGVMAACFALVFYVLVALERSADWEACGEPPCPSSMKSRLAIWIFLGLIGLSLWLLSQVGRVRR
jgi:hypothetical protein